MFVEISKSKYEKLEKKLKELGLNVEISDCTLPKEIEIMLHIEFPSLTNEQKIIIQKEIESIYGKGETVNKFYTNDLDADGLSDVIQKDINKIEENNKYRQKNERKASDDHYVSLNEAVENFTKGDDDYESII